jgi:hypothetical protein
MKNGTLKEGRRTEAQRRKKGRSRKNMEGRKEGQGISRKIKEGRTEGRK